MTAANSCSLSANLSSPRRDIHEATGESESVRLVVLYDLDGVCHFGALGDGDYPRQNLPELWQCGVVIHDFHFAFKLFNCFLAQLLFLFGHLWRQWSLGCHYAVGED